MRFFFFHFKFSVFNISLDDYVYCSGFGRRRFLSWVDRFLRTSRRPQSRKQHKHRDPKLLGIIRLATKRNCPVVLGFVACDVTCWHDGSPVEIWSSACVGIFMRTGGNALADNGCKALADNGYEFISSQVRRQIFRRRKRWGIQISSSKETLLMLQKLIQFFLRKVELPPTEKDLKSWWFQRL